MHHRTELPSLIKAMLSQGMGGRCYKPLLCLFTIDNDTILIFDSRSSRQNRQLPENWVSYNGMQLSCLRFIEDYRFCNILVEMGRAPTRVLPASFYYHWSMFLIIML
jgi:hypothetical protein